MVTTSAAREFFSGTMKIRALSVLLQWLLFKTFDETFLKANSHRTDKRQQTSLFEFIGSVCYPCSRWFELFGVCFHPTEHAYRYRVGRCLLVQCEHDSYFS